MRQAVDSSKQFLKLSVRCARNILWDFVTGQVDCDPGETTLSVRDTKETTASNEADRSSGNWLDFSLVDNFADRWVVGHEELVTGCAVEPLCSVPCHVVEGGKGAVGNEEIVEMARANDDIVGPLDHVGKGVKRGRR